MPRPAGKMVLQDHDKPQSLYVTTRRLIKRDKRPLRMIAQATAIPYYWLKKFSAGEIPNPAVNRVQFLYEFLSLKPLNL